MPIHVKINSSVFSFTCLFSGQIFTCDLHRCVAVSPLFTHAWTHPVAAILRHTGTPAQVLSNDGANENHQGSTWRGPAVFVSGDVVAAQHEASRLGSQKQEVEKPLMTFGCIPVFFILHGGVGGQVCGGVGESDKWSKHPPSPPALSAPPLHFSSDPT